ncbi:agmatinase [Pontiellaceae bacterium B12227]|nr:agmatinase [Pontiellaceae bacterium B12227]
MKKFLESEIPDMPAEDCLFHVIPAPYEKTVSYGGGAAKGPAAILDASYQLEAFDGESCPCTYGIHTRKAQYSLEFMEREIAEVLKLGKIPVMLGGEHTVTVSALKALKETGEAIGIIQFDAHADLRAEYEGDPLSHACALHHAIAMDFPLFQIGVRALSLPEVELRKEKNIPHLDGYEIGRNGIPDNLLPDDFPDKVYITVDVDGLDPSIMPATGTPEPGGLDWFQLFHCLEQITASKTVVGFDVVELAPIEKQHAPDFLCARMIYNLMGLITRRL